MKEIEDGFINISGFPHEVGTMVELHGDRHFMIHNDHKQTRSSRGRRSPRNMRTGNCYYTAFLVVRDFTTADL